MKKSGDPDPHNIKCGSATLVVEPFHCDLAPAPACQNGGSRSSYSSVVHNFLLKISHTSLLGLRQNSPALQHCYGISQSWSSFWDWVQGFARNFLEVIFFYKE